ncbi:MAG: hypothetical protein ACOZCF_02155 [Bacillota bacterium]
MMVDECHHIPAFTFEQVLKHTKARYVVGFSCTAGPFVSVSALRNRPRSGPFVTLSSRETEYHLPPELEDGPIQSIYASLSMDPKRNDLIILFQILWQWRRRVAHPFCSPNALTTWTSW